MIANSCPKFKIYANLNNQGIVDLPWNWPPDMRESAKLLLKLGSARHSENLGTEIARLLKASLGLAMKIKSQA